MNDSRPSRDYTLMSVAEAFAQRSTCARLHVGAVFSRNGRILVTGYNGAPAGMPHCEHLCTCMDGHSFTFSGTFVHYPGCPYDKPCTTAEHAERNAIAWAARNGVALEGCEVHVTHQPCLPCAMSLINAGVEKVTFSRPYRIPDGVDLLVQAGIDVVTYRAGV